MLLQTKIVVAVSSFAAIMGLLSLLQLKRISVTLKVPRTDTLLKCRNAFKEKRNEISKLLNNHRQLFGQQNCEMKALQAQNGKTVIITS